MDHANYTCWLMVYQCFLTDHDLMEHSEEICEQLRMDKGKLGINGVYPKSWK